MRPCSQVAQPSSASAGVLRAVVELCPPKGGLSMDLVAGAPLHGYPELLQVRLLFQLCFDRIAPGPYVLCSILIHVLLLLQFKEILHVTVDLLLQQYLRRVFAVLGQRGLPLLGIEQVLVGLPPLEVYDLLVVCKSDEFLRHGGALLDVSGIFDVNKAVRILLVAKHLRQRPVDLAVVLSHVAVQVPSALRQLPSAVELLHVEIPWKCWRLHAIL
mmetsp:Transcript_125021/g.365146  ORF Transcript_125021/g.365146 Transcript_125021/m.365146 type:complete len:215 (+) Transcript_125021:44-688(+)